MTDVRPAAALFSLLAHPGRLAVVALLSEGPPRSAGELQSALEIERTSLSHQLRLLRQGGLLRVERDGRHRLYSLADHHVAHIVRDALVHVSCLPEDPS